MMTTVRRSALVAALFLALVAHAFAAPKPSPIKSANGYDFSAAQQLLERAIADHAFPGCTVAVGRRDEVLWVAAIGKYDYQSDAAVTPDTLYDLASLSKVVGVTPVVVCLVRDGKLKLDEPVGGRIPEWLTVATDATDRLRREHATVRHLLTHSAGLPGWKPLFRNAHSYADVLQGVFATPLEADPGTKFEYSDLGVILLGELASRAGGAPLAELERRLVFDPIGMQHTLRNPPSELAAQIAPTEKKDSGPGFWRGIVHDENARAGEGITAHAGLFAPAGDLALYAREWLLALGDESRVLPKELAKQFVTRDAMVKGSSRALGWDTPSGKSSAGSRFSSRSFGHTGFTGTSLWIDPERDLYVVLLTNRVHPSRDNNRILAVRRELADAVAAAIDKPRAQPKAR